MGRLSCLLTVVLALASMGAATPEPMAGADAALPSGVPYAAPSDPVRIASIQLPPGTVHGGDVASATVITTSNAAALTARVGNYLVDVPKIAPGTFVLSLRVPRLPLPSYRAHIVLTAIRADGASAEQTISIRIRY